MAKKIIPVGTSVKVIGGRFAGHQGKVFTKDNIGDSQIPLPPSPDRNSYWVVIEENGRTFEAYLSEDQIEVI